MTIHFENIDGMNKLEKLPKLAQSDRKCEFKKMK